ncbi:hypothetical protein L211DRAFT_465283 [Terfezia boudieri ATCC MYA-4762]|uniref:Uncharacterized protein n=1 Tax=Terfezia boudieri ATCC MYA-4762 TaxID=1051890 RepID=A0A3N4M1K1_9PEZI|nr:hypothetical protein L211DRAFT_465283 [Terfezia boudieri ATCC MYA-4762]
MGLSMSWKLHFHHSYALRLFYCCYSECCRCSCCCRCCRCCCCCSHSFAAVAAVMSLLSLCCCCSSLPELLVAKSLCLVLFLLVLLLDYCAY